jgi:hypothetical protein
LRDHGAPVWAAWNSSVGTQGRYRIAVVPKPSAPSTSRARRSAFGARNSSASQTTNIDAPRNSAQLWVYSATASESPNSTGQRRAGRSSGV